MARPLVPPAAEIYTRGISAARVVAMRALPELKSGSYLTSVLAQKEAVARGADEALLVDGQGHVREGATANLFIVVGERLCTPGVAVLPGVTRALVLALASSLELAVAETEIAAASLAGVDELFLTSSVRGLVPVVRVDGEPVGRGRPGPVYERLRAAYDARAL